MSGIMRHRFQSTAADVADATLFRPSDYGSTSTDYATAPTHVLSGGAHGSLVARSTLTVDGADYVPAAAGVLAASDSGQMPAFRALTADDLPVGVVRVLDQWGGTASVSATVNEEVLRTIILPAGLLGSNGRLEIIFRYDITSSSNIKTVRVRMGVVGSGLTGAKALEYPLGINTIVMIHAAAMIQSLTDSSQLICGSFANAVPYGAFNSANTGADLALDSTLAIEINITGQKATAGETFSLRSSHVRFSKL